jgi:hypothetical protein
VAKDAIDHKEAWFLANPANLTAVEDLTELSYLHEPAGKLKHPATLCQIFFAIVIPF